MERTATIQRPGILTRVLLDIGRRMFGMVLTPQQIMARRLPLMLGIGGLYGAIEWFAKTDRQLRALLNMHVAALYAVPY